MSHKVWGYIFRQDQPFATYFVQWTLGESEHPANFDLILGEWGEVTGPKDRYAVSLLYRNDEEMNAFMLIDAKGRPHADGSLAEKALSRDELLGTPLAKEIFEAVDAIMLGDPRVSSIKTKPPSTTRR